MMSKDKNKKETELGNVEELLDHSLDDDMIEEIEKLENEEKKEEQELEDDNSKEKNEIVIECGFQCIVRTPTLMKHKIINDSILLLKDHFFDEKNVKMHEVVKSLEAELVSLYARDYIYTICNNVAYCDLIRHDLKVHREILRVIVTDVDAETVAENNLIKALDYIEGLRSKILVSNLNTKANVSFTNTIEETRNKIYHLYNIYGSRVRSPREERLFSESKRSIELEINVMMGHVIASGMKRREEMDKWGKVAEDARKYTAALSAQRKMGPVGGREPAPYRSIMEADPTFLNTSLDKFNEMRRQQEQQLNQQPDLVKKQKLVHEKIKKQRDD